MSIGSLIQRAQLYWHTVKYLKPVQIYGRFWFKFYRPRPVTTPAPALRVPSGNWTAPAQRRQSLTGEGEFYFLNQAGSLSELGWDNLTTEKLWRYNQHYFDDLNAENANERSIWHQSLLLNWITSNPPGKGTGWEPYPTSLRIVNWIKWRLAGHTLPSNALHSLAIQTRWLAKRLEIHLLGNHLFANAKALIFAGLVFDGSEADRWLAKGLSIVERELPEQVLSDGGNFERSPMYHSIFLEDVLDLINVANVWPAKIDLSIVHNWRQVALKMLDWLQGMTHPDGQIGLFNDAAFNVCPAPDQLSAYAARLQLNSKDLSPSVKDDINIRHWSESGYIRLESRCAVALLDVAPIGPDYLPSHANADTLSFELSLFGQRVIVNGGTSRYGVGVERLSERQTSAHSTAELDGLSSSEVWGGFRVARRANPIGLALAQSAGRVTVSCAHTGYQHLRGRPKPVRNWEITPSSLEVRDLVQGSYREMVTRYHFHPSVSVTAISSTSYLISLSSARTVKLVIKSGSGKLVVAKYADEFGKSVATSCLKIMSITDGIAVQFEWAVA